MDAKKEIAINYLELLEKGNIKDLLKLFSENSIVDSPVYGIRNAPQFYNDLKNDTLKSVLELKGIFEEKDSNKIAVYFNFKWTLINNNQVDFDVVDVIEFNDLNQIIRLKIIYDTSKITGAIDALRN
jgi:hypothetical protein